MNEDIIITRDDEYRGVLIDRLKQQMGTGVRRSGVHVSDLVFCTRKAWAEKTMEYIGEVSERTLLTWLRGLSHEALVSEGVEQVRAGYCFTCQYNHPWDPRLNETHACRRAAIPSWSAQSTGFS